MAEVRWERTKGVLFKPDASFTPSAVAARWDEITDFTNPDHPKGMGDSDLNVRAPPFLYLLSR